MDVDPCAVLRQVCQEAEETVRSLALDSTIYIYIPLTPSLTLSLSCFSQVCQEAEEAVEELRSQDTTTREQLNTAAATLQVRLLPQFGTPVLSTTTG